MFDQLDLSNDGQISRREFNQFFSSHLATQSNARKYNRLLVKPTIGSSRTSSYNLPGNYHTYGMELKRDAEGAGQVVTDWKSFRPVRNEKEGFV